MSLDTYYDLMIDHYDEVIGVQDQRMTEPTMHESCEEERENARSTVRRFVTYIAASYVFGGPIIRPDACCSSRTCPTPRWCRR